MQYPTYHRKENKCFKRVSDTKVFEVHVPVEGSHLPTIHTPSVYPSKQRLDEEIATMQRTDIETYESYCFTCYQAMDRNRSRLVQVREKRTAPSKSPLHGVAS